MNNAKSILKNFKFENYKITHTEERWMVPNKNWYYGRRGFTYPPSIALSTPVTVIAFDDDLKLKIIPNERDNKVVFFTMNWIGEDHLKPFTVTKVKDIIPAIKKSEGYRSISIKNKLTKFVKE